VGALLKTCCCGGKWKLKVGWDSHLKTVCYGGSLIKQLFWENTIK
jgi:hypothetical protein